MALEVDVAPADEAVALDDARRALVASAVEAALRDRGVEDAELSVTLMDDPAITKLNREWKAADRPTDVLAFTLSEGDEKPLMGDIYIGVEQVARQAAEYGEDPDRELARVAIHAALHVLGFDHPEEDRETSEMWGHQERILGEWEGR